MRTTSFYIFLLFASPRLSSGLFVLEPDFAGIIIVCVDVVIVLFGCHLTIF